MKLNEVESQKNEIEVSTQKTLAILRLILQKTVEQLFNANIKSKNLQSHDKYQQMFFICSVEII